MATAKYTIAPPSLTPLLHEFGDYENIPDECWREYIAAHRFWARAWEMYAGRKPRSEVSSKGVSSSKPSSSESGAG
jgi:hypothetical protein